jgi:glycosyltransferase involved in cell wall biosynthesis
MRLISIGSVESSHGGKTTGGVARTHSLLTKSWVMNPELGIDVIGVIATNSDHFEDPITGVPYISRNEGESQAKALTRIIDEYKPDCILLHHIATGWGWSLQDVPNLPNVIGFVHSWRIVWKEFDSKYPKKLNFAKTAINYLDSLLYHTQHCANEMVEFGIFPSCPIHIIPPPLEMGGFSKNDLLTNRESNHIVYLGNLLEHKNAHSLVQAIIDLKDVSLTIIGSGELENSLTAYIIENNLSDRVFLAGYATDEQVSEYFLRADIFCAPSRYEQFSLVYLEALAHGLPVIGYGPTIDAIRSEMDVDCGHSLYNFEPEYIRQAIEETIAKQWDRKKLHDNVRESFNPKRIAQRFATALVENTTQDSGK